MNKLPWQTKLETLNKRIEAFPKGYRQNVSILGNDPEETTYLLENYLQTNMFKEINYIHATSSYSGEKEFFKSIIFSLLSNYTHLEDTIDNLITYASPVLEKTTSFIKNCFQKEKFVFLDILEVINLFITESNRNCLLIIEEFLDLKDLFKNIYPEFSNFLVIQRNCMVILTSSNTKEAEKILAGELNLLFGNFEKIYLNDNFSLQNYLYLKEKIYPINPSAFFLSYFVNILGSNIVYYDLIADIIKDKYDPNNEDESIIIIIKSILYSKTTGLFQKFIKKIDLIKLCLKDYIPILKLLISLSQGYLRKRELLSLNIYNNKELTSKLQKLVDLNYIENLGNIYKLNDSLFSFWLSHIFTLYFSPAILSPKLRISIFKKKMIEDIAIQKEEFFKDKLKKVLQLFSSFRNDTLQLGKNKYRLPILNNTKVISYPKNDFHLLIGKGKEIIFAGIKEKNVDDNDILDFIEKGSNIKGKRVKKIFISLDDIPHRVRLIAKNNKLTMWDLQEVNNLLNIYNKPVVPLNL
ncbi:MAG: hypothetical protein KAI91_02550 [Candidatus Omnitrophica bacterium]|nr:hypothetical protein [Candidatus Omnitrophota bacterium]